MNTLSDLKCLNISREVDFSRYADQIINLTNRSRDDLFYLLYLNKKSYAFCIMDGDELVGFQGFVYKPIMINDQMIPSFRSEFTIAVPRLRGTGIFPEFYKYAMDVLKVITEKCIFGVKRVIRDGSNLAFT